MNNQWVKCSERLPYDHPYRQVLVYLGYNQQCIMWSPDLVYNYNLHNGFKGTHWMELPDRPEMEE